MLLSASELLGTCSTVSASTILPLQVVSERSFVDLYIATMVLCSLLFKLEFIIGEGTMLKSCTFRAWNAVGAGVDELGDESLSILECTNKLISTSINYMILFYFIWCLYTLNLSGIHS